MVWPSRASCKVQSSRLRDQKWFFWQIWGGAVWLGGAGWAGRGGAGINLMENQCSVHRMSRNFLYTSTAHPGHGPNTGSMLGLCADSFYRRMHNKYWKYNTAKLSAYPSWICTFKTIYFGPPWLPPHLEFQFKMDQITCSHFPVAAQHQPSVILTGEIEFQTTTISHFAPEDRVKQCDNNNHK